MTLEPKPQKENTLQILLHSMNKQELEVLRSYLLFFGSRKEKETKSLKLMEFLLATKDPLSDDDCSKFIYGIPKDTKIDKLKSRLKSKVLDSLINDINIDRNKEWDDTDIITVKLRKRLTQYYFLFFSRTAQPIVDQILEEVVSLSKKYEKYSILSEALEIKKNKSKNENYYDKLSKEIVIWNRCHMAVSISISRYFKMLIKQKFSLGFQKSEFERYLSESLALLKKEYLISKSSTVLFYLLNIEIEYYNYIEEFKKSRNSSLKLLSLLKTKVAVNRKVRVGLALLSLGEKEVLLKNYSEAIKYSIECQKYFAEKSLNFSIIKELEFLALFYSKKYEQCFNRVQFLYSNTPKGLGMFRIGKMAFYLAFSQFVLGKYKDTLRTLRENSAISQDKAGWDIGLRMLIIQSLIELGDFDEAGSAIEALRKHIERSKRDQPIRGRDKVIYNVLYELGKRSFDFKKTYIEERDQFNKLGSKERKYCWEPFTHELYPFQEWFKSKLKPRFDL